LPVRQLRGLHAAAAGLVRRTHAQRAHRDRQAARELGRRPGDARPGGRRSRRRAVRRRPLKHLLPDGRLARNAARVNGTPTLRQAFVPQPVVGVAPAQLRAYIDGLDPVSKRPFMQELLEGLTAPLTEDDLTGVSFERSTPRLLEPAAEDELHRRFEAEHWT